MKPRDVQRSVRSFRNDRSAGDAPNIGRVGRVPGTGLSKGVRRRRRRGESGQGDRARRNRRKVMMTWSAVFMLVALGAMGTAVWLWARPNMNRPASVVGKAAVPLQERVVSEFESPSEEEALLLVKRALAIRDPSAVGDFFHPGTTSPAEVVDFLKQMEKKDGRIASMDWLSSVDANGLLIDAVLVVFPSDSTPRNRLAMLTPDAKGKWKIDFDAFARTVKPSWRELMENRSGQGVVRVLIAKDAYYNGIFKDDAQWVCYGMASPDNDGILLGYCRKGSPQADAMRKIIDDEDMTDGAASLNRATLEIRRHEGSEPRQFEITRVLAEDWVLGPKPFDEKFK